jgi:hypothetical protein
VAVTLRTIAVFLVVALLPAPAFAWGFAAHKYIMRRAIELLPAELKRFYATHREEVVLRATDPDLWRIVGWEDDPNHFVNFGISEYGAYPFTALPREYGAAVEKFGLITLKRNGTLPWRTAEEFGQLRRAFEGFTRRTAYATSDAVLFAAVAAHYIQDAYQPLHATDNYDGQRTGQQGVHARFERDLFERYESRLTAIPAPPKPMTSPRDAAFDALLGSHQLVTPLLDADREAAGGRKQYDDAYFEAFFAKSKPILERRVSEAITATASLIVGAWAQAGQPDLANDKARPVQSLRK